MVHDGIYPLPPYLLCDAPFDHVRVAHAEPFEDIVYFTAGKPPQQGQVVSAVGIRLCLHLLVPFPGTVINVEEKLHGKGLY